MLTLDPHELKRRLTARLSLFEMIALVVTISFAVWTVIQHARAPIAGLLDDYTIFTQAGKGNSQGYYYSLWGLPVFYPFSLLPFNLGAVLWNLLNIAGMFAAARLFTGNGAPLLFSYPMMITLYFGQISGVICLAAALMWWGLSKRSWLLAGIGLTIALIKPQMGAVAGMLWLFALLQLASDKETRRIFWLAMLVPAFTAAASFLIQPDWLGETLLRLHATPPIAASSVTAWPYLGLWGLLLFLPALALPLRLQPRLLALAAAWVIAMPYFQVWEVSALLMLMAGVGPVFTWLAILPGYSLMPLFFLLLLAGFYLWQITPGVLQLFAPSGSRFSGQGQYLVTYFKKANIIDRNN